VTRKAVDHDLTPEQELFRATVRDFCDREITREYVRECDRERRPPRDLYDKLGEQGWLGINIPEEYGGAGAGSVEVAILLEELGRAFLDLSFWVFRAVTWGGLAIGTGGSEELKSELLPRVASGELTVCFSLTEPDAGSDAAAITLSAVEDGDDYVLNGQKVFTSGFKASDLDVVATRTSTEGKKHHGITNFIVDTDSPGLEWQPIETLGHWPLGTAMLYFNEVRVPKTRMLGTLHEGWADLGVYLRYERLCLSAARTGAAAAALADSVAYAKERRQFDRPIAEFQAVSHRLADMQTMVEISRMLVYRYASRLDRGLASTRDAAILKLYACEAYKQVADMGLQVLGGYGYTMEYDLQRHFRESRLGVIGAGTSDIQRNIIAKTMGL
jgi:alkylation response protein AidB-like acyl-CoA dehydrogenase